jgi:diadenosine tetraphosphate (Ap4A) HIT family hydrolase
LTDGVRRSTITAFQRDQTELEMTAFALAERLQADCLLVGDAPLSRVLLFNDARYPWVILVPRRIGVSEIYQLQVGDQQQLIAESSKLGEWLMSSFQGDKLNVAAIGNLVPQLHLHHVVRFRDDPAWPAPVWGHSTAVPYDRDVARERIAGLRGALDL